MKVLLSGFFLLNFKIDNKQNKKKHTKNSSEGSDIFPKLMRLVWVEYYLLSRPIFLAVLELYVACLYYHQK